ncbi:hypothetical protein [Rhodococcoides fascians]|uniref:hypothetical protein n=1 Tax=Rhodococcoides fascians TaxID=1828 RepID=UPI00117BBCCF|nr:MULTISPECIES: hypothetical protein [Rhodococcus]
MTGIGPLLRQLVGDTTEAEESIQLELRTAAGDVHGHTTSHEDFWVWATNQLGITSGYNGTMSPEPDFDYMHMTVTSDDQHG